MSEGGISRKERVRHALDQLRLLRDKDERMSYEEFWTFYHKYQQQVLKAKGEVPSMKKVVGGFKLNSSQKEVLRSVCPDEPLLCDAVVLYIDFVEKREAQRVQKIISSKESLPIFKHKQEIVELVKENQVTIIAGDTGCGKSTQVPQYLMEAGFEKIACTQPRRIACISLSKRVAYETFNAYGTEVGYQIRFESVKTEHTRILFLTEGVLLRQIQGSADFDLYNVLVLDEVHERHLTTDFLIGILKSLLKHKPDLKLVLMSATINIDLFAGYFTDAPVVQVPGRLWPIELQYDPIKTDEPEEGKKEKRRGPIIDPRPFIRVLRMIDKKYPAKERGDCLMFLSGINEIMTVLEAIQSYAEESKRWIALPLHSSLSIEQQDAVFNIAPEGVRKCVLSTNIAETSVTIDGIRFVVDSGKVKEISYDTALKMQRLQEFWVSKASAEQRKGRAGRTGPGVCIRLYSLSDFDSFQEYSTPELQRVSLDSVILQMASMGLEEVRKFPFLQPPSEPAIVAAIQLLQEHGALHPETNKITPVGQLLSHLPVDITIGKLMLMASLFHTVDAVLSIAAGLSTLSVFTFKSHKNTDAKDLIKPLLSNHGDPFTLLEVIRDWLEHKRRDGEARKWCRRRGIEEQRLYEINKLKNQFLDILQDSKILDRKEEHSHDSKSKDDRMRESKDKKRLNDMKKHYDKKRKRRKVLSIQDNAFDMQSSDDDEDTALGASIRDLEFKLQNDLDSEVSPILTLKDVNMLKIIMCHGLYPNFAVPDSNNGFKKSSEQVFHTKHKMFLSLHPTSTLINFPEYFEITPGQHQLSSKMATSSDHQLVVFSNILATRKPYIVNSFRSPALQTLLLFCKSIDTNLSCTKLIFDSWLEVEVQDGQFCQEMLFNAIKLRECWDELLEIRLSVFKKRSLETELVVKPRAKELERILIDKLSRFLHCAVEYTIRRCSVTKDSYTGVYPVAVLESLPEKYRDFALSAKDTVHSFKGGYQLNEYLTFGCVAEEGHATGGHIQTVWTCDTCGVTMACTFAQRVSHKEECKAKEPEKEAEEKEEKKEEATSSSTAPSYFCNTCQKTLNCSLPDFMRHRRSHANQ